MDTMSSCPGVGGGAQTHHANLGVLCMVCYLMFKHGVCWKYQYNNYMFNFIDQLHFYSCEWLCR